MQSPPLLSAAWFAYASRELNNDARSWMADLPRRIYIEIGGCRLAVIHGGVDMINRFIFASTATAIKLGEIRKTGVDGIMGGHCGLPFTQAINRRLWHNALGIDRCGNLYWNGRPIEVRYILLTGRQTVWAVIIAVSALIGAIGAFAPLFSLFGDELGEVAHQPGRGSLLHRTAGPHIRVKRVASDPHHVSPCRFGRLVRRWTNSA
jgi:hypothetical protein